MSQQENNLLDAVVIGAGAAGVGVGVALMHAGLENFLIVDRHRVGASFDLWPAETRFITPSFPTNSVGMLDLNSIAIGVSPAYSLQVEHPTGRQYAGHLRGVAKYFELPVQDDTDVLRVAKADEVFLIDTAKETLRAKHIVWAGGEFQYPHRSVLPGQEHCLHTATIRTYEDLSGDDFIVIGGYESGVDAAYHLARNGKQVRLFDKECAWSDDSSDPSTSLSTYSLERMREEHFVERVKLFPNSPIASVKRTDEAYEVTTTDGRTCWTPTPPLYAGGFDGGQSLVGELFERREDGFPLLTEDDESTITPGAFLCGPTVRHENHVFCFIYKYRQRFAVVAKTIATSLGLPAEELEQYRQWGMYLDDLSCCGEECVC